MNADGGYEVTFKWTKDGVVSNGTAKGALALNQVRGKGSGLIFQGTFTFGLMGQMHTLGIRATAAPEDGTWDAVPFWLNAQVMLLDRFQMIGGFDLDDMNKTDIVADFRRVDPAAR